MKSKILKLCPVVLLFLFLGASCQKDEFEYADESIEVYNSPGIAVYNTKGDYFNLVDLNVDSLNNITMIRSYITGDSRVLMSENGNITFSNRWRLKSGYIVAKEVSIRYSFTNITLKEYVDYTTKYNSGAWTDEMLLPRIIDRDPFLSFYYLNGINQSEMKFTLGEINEMLENGTIEKYFTKLK
jgi:hypothetical protein